MPDVGQIILQAAQGIVQQKQNQQRLAMQATQFGMQLQQAERTFQLQKTELDLREQVMKHKEEDIELATRRAATGERAVAVQEGQLELQQKTQQVMGGLNTLLMEHKVTQAGLEVEKMRAELAGGASPQSLADTLLVKNPAFLASLDKQARTEAVKRANSQFLIEGQVTIGGKTITKPKNMPAVSEDTVQEELATVTKMLISLKPKVEETQRAVGFMTGRRKATLQESLATQMNEMRSLESRKAEFEQYAMSYQQVASAGSDPEWKRLGYDTIGASNPTMRSLIGAIGVQEVKGIETGQGDLLYFPTQRLSFIGGGVKGKTPGKFEKFKSDSGATYRKRLKDSWGLLKNSEPGAEAWDTGMGLLKSLSRDEVADDPTAVALINCLRHEWSIDANSPEEESKFRRTMQAYLQTMGARAKR